MEISVKGEPKEIAALVAALQGQQNGSNSPDSIIREVVRQAIGDKSKALSAS